MADFAKLTVRMLAENQKLFTELKKSTRAVNRFQKNTDKSLKKVEGSFSRLGRAATLVKGALIAVGAVSVGRRIVDTGLAVESLNLQFEFIAGSAKAARKELDFVNETAERLGVVALDAAKGYVGIAAAAKAGGIASKDARNIFVGVTSAMSALGKTTFETQGALQAIEQIISKGKVSSEELRQQLGERLPGALELSAKAIGKTVEELDEMLKKGELLAKDFIPELARVLNEDFADAAEKAGGSALGAFNNLTNTINELETAIANSGFIDFLADVARAATKTFNILGNIADRIKNIRARFAALESVGAPKTGLIQRPELEDAFRPMVQDIMSGTEALEEFNKKAIKTASILGTKGGKSKQDRKKKSAGLTFEDQSLLADVLPDAGSRALLGEMNKDIEKFEAGIMGARRETEAWEKGIQQTEKAANDLGFVFESRLEDAIIDMTTETVKLRDILRALAQDILRIIIRRAATEPLGDLISAGVRGATGAVTNYIDARGATGDTEAAVNRALGGADLGQSITSSFNDSIARGGALTQIR